MKYCIHCGKEINETAYFCPHCGKKQAKEKDTESGKAGDDIIQDSIKAAREKCVSAGKTGLQMLNEEINASDVREFRIVDNKGYFAGIAALAILTFLTCLGSLVCLGSARVSILDMLITFMLLVFILGVKKTYLCDYFIIMILTIIPFGIDCILEIGSLFEIDKLFEVDSLFRDGMNGFTSTLGFLIASSLGSFLLAVISVFLFGQIVKGKRRKTWLLLMLSLNLVIAMLRSFLIVLEHHILFPDHILLLVTLILFVLSISNDPDKVYASRTEPAGKHIRTRNIGFSILMSILTCGLYLYIIISIPPPSSWRHK